MNRFLTNFPVVQPRTSPVKIPAVSNTASSLLQNSSPTTARNLVAPSSLVFVPLGIGMPQETPEKVTRSCSK